MIAKAGHTLTHERASDQPDAAGGRRRSWATLASGVPCWMQPASARIRELFARREMAVTHSVYVATDLDCQADDRITVTVRGTDHVLMVRGYIDAAGLGTFWRIDAEEIA